MGNLDFCSPLILNLEPIDFPTQHMWSDSQFYIIKRYVEDFERSLDQDHEVGMLLTNFGHSVLMIVTNISYEKSVLMVFRGYIDDKEATLIQHINQLNFILVRTAIKAERPKKKIGFITTGEWSKEEQ